MALKRSIITTLDGSKTIHIKEWNEQYHSKHGALQEAYHVFIKHGLYYYVEKNEPSNKVSILEIGLGTGLNAFITALESKTLEIPINYVGVEAYPVSKAEIKLLNYTDLISPQDSNLFNELHNISWGISKSLTPTFTITKQQRFFLDIKDKDAFNIIYFDAFGARVQPELWTENMFQLMYNALKINGVLVTYSAKGSVRRAMQSVGFEVERLEGPPGKREMLRALKKV